MSAPANMNQVGGQRQPPPPGSQRQFEPPQSLEEARSMVADSVDWWAEKSGASADEVSRISGVFDGMMDEAESVRSQVEAGELEPQEAMAILAEDRTAALDGLRAEMGDEAFFDLWQNSGAGRLLSPRLLPPRLLPPPMQGRVQSWLRRRP